MKPLQRARSSHGASKLRSCAPRLAPLALALAMAGLLAAGCGGGSSTAAGAQSGSSSGSKSALGLRYAQCMRAHGVASFPDPSAGGGLSVSKSTVSSPNFHSAQQACQSVAPGGTQGGGTPSPAVQAQLLRFARCMRAHGVPNFPDPTFSGGSESIPLAAGTSSSPQFQRAQQACQSQAPAGGKLS